jgi:hypothetical protein
MQSLRPRQPAPSGAPSPVPCPAAGPSVAAVTHLRGPPAAGPPQKIISATPQDHQSPARKITGTRPERSPGSRSQDPRRRDPRSAAGPKTSRATEVRSRIQANEERPPLRRGHASVRDLTAPSPKGVTSHAGAAIKTSELRATPGGYGGKPPGVAFIGVPTGARNAGSGAPTGDQSTDMNVTRKRPLVCQDLITTRSPDDAEQVQSRGR